MCGSLFFEFESDVQLSGSVIRSEGLPGMCIHVQELLPQIGAVDTQFAQFTQRLQRTAPAGYAPENVVQAVPVKSMFLAIPQAVRLCHTPLHKRVVQILAAMDFIRCDPHILFQLVLPAQQAKMFVDHMGLEPTGTPAAGMGRPAEPPICDQLCVRLCRVFIEILLCCKRRLQPGNRSADGLLQPVQVVIHFLKNLERTTSQTALNQHSASGCTLYTACCLGETSCSVSLYSFLI